MCTGPVHLPARLTACCAYILDLAVRIHFIIGFSLLLQVTEVENDVSPVQEDEAPNAISQLAKKVCDR